jgi:hypothetical protein
VPVKPPSLLSGELTPVMSMLIVTVICWPMLGVPLEGVADDVTLPVGGNNAALPSSVVRAKTGPPPITTLPSASMTTRNMRQ